MAIDFQQSPAVPLAELQRRWGAVRSYLPEVAPGAEGLLVFSRLNIYYLAGSMANGVLWLPAEGQPVLLCRRGRERAVLESPLGVIGSYRSFRELPGVLADAGSPLSRRLSVEMNGIPWNLGRSLTAALPDVEFVAGDRALSWARGVKSPWEVERLRETGRRHDRVLSDLLPPLLRPGMGEREIAVLIWDLFFREGHQGILRMENYGEEAFLGHVSAGDSANYPSVFNGPAGLRGVHPAAVAMGAEDVLWSEGQLLLCDVGFAREGYHTDKTQVYWPGRAAEIPARVREAHEFCVRVQGWLVENLRPGAIPEELAAHCFGWAEKAGWAEGFMALGGNKVAFLGHGIGLAIDEYPVLARGFDRPLEEGMVLALEPKMGLPGVGMAGLENTFEVTGSGGRPLSGERFDMIAVGG